MFRAILNQVCLCLLAVVLAQTARGDVVTLQNGDRISGMVKSIVDGKLAIETEYAGTITLSMDAVASIESEQALSVLLADESVVEGVLTFEEGALGVKADADWHPVETARIVALAPDRDALDALLLSPEPKRWSGSVNIGATVRSGNTDTTDLKGAVALKRDGDNNTLKLGLSAAYGAADGTLNTRRYAGNVRWQYYVHERLYLYTMGLAEQDDGRKLDLRMQGGAGMGYDIVDREKTTLSADLGLTYTYERWAPFTPWERDRIKSATRSSAYNRLYSAIPGLVENGLFSLDTARDLREIWADINDPLRNYSRQSEDYPNLRIGVQFTRALFKNSMLSEELVLMPNLEDMGEFRGLSELAITTPVTESISLRTSLKSEYDSLARRKNVDEWDHLLMSEITYSF